MWEKVDDDHPQRCQGTNTHGQCNNKAMENSNFCPAHGGNRGRDIAKKKELRNYRLARFNARLIELGNNDGIMSLRDEIAVLRVILEEKWNMAKDTHDLMLMSGPLSDLVVKIEKLVTSANRLESKLGNYLNKTKILQFAQIIIQIIGQHVNDENTLETIAEEILTALQKEE